MSADEDLNESVVKRRRPFGGQPSRVELYVIAVVVFLLAAGGVSGAVVISSNDSATTTTSASAPALSAGAAEPEVPQVSSPDSDTAAMTTTQPSPGSANSQSTSGAVVRDEALQRVIDQQIEAERLAKVRSDYLVWAKNNPITRIDGVQVISQSCSAPDSGESNSFQIRFSYTNFGNAHFLGAADPTTGNNSLQYGIQYGNFEGVSWPLSTETPGSHTVILSAQGPASVRSGLVMFGSFTNLAGVSETDPVPYARNLNFRIPLSFSC